MLKAIQQLYVTKSSIQPQNKATSRRHSLQEDNSRIDISTKENCKIYLMKLQACICGSKCMKDNNLWKLNKLGSKQFNKEIDMVHFLNVIRNL